MLLFVRSQVPFFILGIILILTVAHTAADVGVGGTRDVIALASAKPSRKSPKRNSSSASGVSTGGFASGNRGKGANQIPVVSDSANNEAAKRTVRNLFSVCSHIQNPELYQPNWADNASYQTTEGSGKSAVVASRTVKKGQVLTLFPIHALGFRTLLRNADAKKKKKHRREDTEFVAYDLDRDGQYFREESQQAGLRMKLNIPLDDSQPASSAIADRKNKVLFAMLFRDEIVPGWVGGRVRSTASSSEANCVTIPLPGAAPLCAVVATKDIIYEGEELVQGLTPGVKLLDECKDILAKEYETELTELKAYIEMACQTTPDPKGDTMPKTSVGGLGAFHEINQQYPGLKQLHHDPDVYVLEDFLSESECDRIISKATPHMRPCIVKNESTGATEQDPSRTSTDANLPQVEAPSIVSKLTKLASCNADQLEILQVLRYTQGQEFKPHTDGYAGPISACGFEQSNRLVTIFCYLNDVDQGGCTNFPEIELSVQPKKGMAVVHFPSNLELREDERTVHQGMPAIDEKFLLATWVWSKARSDEKYEEIHLASLTSDVI